MDIKVINLSSQFWSIVGDCHVSIEVDKGGGVGVVRIVERGLY